MPSRILTEIHDDYLPDIERACAGSLVRPCVVAAMLPNEAGRYRSGPRAGRINPGASRFEPHVYARLKAVRDARAGAYNGVTARMLAGASDEALRNLASSWGPAQMMGYYALWLFKDDDGTPVTIAELRDPARHFRYVVQLLTADAGSRADLAALDEALDARDRRRTDVYFERILRRWNSGSPTGRTYDPDYVAHGLACLHAWIDAYGAAAHAPASLDARATDVGDRPLEVERGNRFDDTAADAPQTVALDSPAPVGTQAGESPMGTTEIAAEVASSTPPAALPPAAGTGALAAGAGSPLAETVKVTAGGASWARTVAGWITTLAGLASGYVRDTLGLDWRVQLTLIGVVAALGVVWFVCKYKAEYQIREIHSDPAKVNVK